VANDDKTEEHVVGGHRDAERTSALPEVRADGRVPLARLDDGRQAPPLLQQNALPVRLLIRPGIRAASGRSA
jgi:hypothetical protein